jgi:site-specific DNA-methyltransferase (adenine-specific)
VSAPEPFYSQDGITIYHGDSREIVPVLAQEPDLLVLDPPFDEWESVPKIDAASVVAFTNWQHRAHPEALYGRPRTEVIWHFLDGRWVSHFLPITTHETILIYGKLNEMYLGEPQDQTPKKIAPHRHMQRIVTPRSVYVPKPRRALNSVLAFPQNSGTEGIGRFAKPLGLMRQLVEWAATGPLILDPYMGAGTTLRIAKDMGLQAIGIEREERYCEMAAARLGQEAMVL